MTLTGVLYEQAAQPFHSLPRVRTCLLVRHPERVPVEGDAPAPALDGGGVDAQQQRRVGRQPARQQLGAARGDVEQQVQVRVREHLHVELLLQPGGEALRAVHLQGVLGLVRQLALARRVGRTWNGIENTETGRRLGFTAEYAQFLLK